MRQLKLWIAVAAAACAPAALAAAETYKIDKVHSTVVFRVKHMNTSYSYGRFNDIEGTVTWDAEKPEEGKFDVKVKTDSIDTGDKKRDTHLEGPDFFNAKQNRFLTFKSKSVKKGEGEAYELEGDLTCNGQTKPLTTKLEMTGSSSSPQGTKVGFESTFTIKRSDFGITYGPDALGDDVRVTVSIEAAKVEKKDKEK